MFQGLLFFLRFGWKSEKRYILYNLTNQILLAGLPVLNIIAPRYIIEELLGAQRPERLLQLAAILLVGNFAGKAISNWLALSAFDARCKVGADFELFISKKLAEADYANLESPRYLNTKEKAQKFLYGDWHGFAYVLDSAMEIIGQFVSFAAIVGVVCAFDVRIVPIFIAFVLVGAAVDSWARKSEMKLSLKQAEIERGNRYYGDLFDDLPAAKEMRIYASAKWLLEKKEQYLRQGLDFYKRRNRFYKISGSLGAAILLLQQCIAYAGLLWSVCSGAIGVGEFSMYTGAVTVFAESMRAVMKSFVDVRAYGIYYTAMEEYLQIPATMRKGNRRRVPDDMIIHFENVTYRYPGQKIAAIKNLTLTLKPGEKLAVVGENGAGKTTFVKLITRMIEPTSGRITLGGVDIGEFDYDAYMALFATVFQDYKLFATSLEENIVFGGDTQPGAAEKCARQVGLGKLLKRLPAGMQTQVQRIFDEEGFVPSGGEGQKIALARALYKNAPIMVLDEPTAALDPRAEFEIYRGFDMLVQGKTAVYISHRLASTQMCDRVLVLSQGCAVECGSHSELLTNGGLYSTLYAMQAKYYATPEAD